MSGDQKMYVCNVCAVVFALAACYCTWHCLDYNKTIAAMENSYEQEVVPSTGGLRWVKKGKE